MVKRLLVVLMVFIIGETCLAGTFLGNYYIKDAPREQVITYLKAHRIEGFLIEQDGYAGLVFCEARAESQAEDYGSHLAVAISRGLKCGVVLSLIYDSDILTLKYYRNGKMLFDYNSWPGYFDGAEQKPRYNSIENFSTDFKADKRKLSDILNNKEYVFADDALIDLVELIGAPECMVYSSYSFKPEPADTPTKNQIHIYEIN